RWRDATQLRVRTFVEERVDGHDEVRVELRHLLEVDLLAANDHKFGVADEVHRPWPGLFGVGSNEVAYSDRCFTESEEEVHLIEPGRDDASRRRFDRRTAELVLDGYGVGSSGRHARELASSVAIAAIIVAGTRDTC